MLKYDKERRTIIAKSRSKNWGKRYARIYGFRDQLLIRNWTYFLIASFLRAIRNRRAFFRSSGSGEETVGSGTLESISSSSFSTCSFFTWETDSTPRTEVKIKLCEFDMVVSGISESSRPEERLISEFDIFLSVLLTKQTPRCSARCFVLGGRNKKFHKAEYYFRSEQLCARRRRVCPSLHIRSPL